MAHCMFTACSLPIPAEVCKTNDGIHYTHGRKRERERELDGEREMEGEREAGRGERERERERVSE